MKATKIWENFCWFTILDTPYVFETKLWNWYTRAFMKCNKCWHEEDKVANQKPRCAYCKWNSIEKIDRWDYFDIWLSNGWYTKVDKEDYEKIVKYTWYKTLRNSVESRRWKLIKLHRLIMNPSGWYVVDHINWDILDNRKSNLRICTMLENTRNTKKIKWTSSIYKWVHYSNSKKMWIWRIVCNWKAYTKSSKNEIQMAYWYDSMADKLFWEYWKNNKKLWLL